MSWQWVYISGVVCGSTATLFGQALAQIYREKHR